MVFISYPELRGNGGVRLFHNALFERTKVNDCNRDISTVVDFDSRL